MQGPEPTTMSLLIAHGALAVFGAVVHASKAHRDGTTKTLVDFITLTIMSSFSGVMFAFLGLHFFAHEIYLTMALAGTGGYIGVEGMTIIIDRFKSVIDKY